MAGLAPATTKPAGRKGNLSFCCQNRRRCWSRCCCCVVWAGSRHPHPHKRNNPGTTGNHGRTNRPDEPTQPNRRERGNGHANPATRHPRNRAETRTGEPNETEPREDKSDNTHKREPEQNGEPQQQNPQDQPRQNPGEPPTRTPASEEHKGQTDNAREPTRPPRTEDGTQTRTKKNKRQQQGKHPQTKNLRRLACTPTGYIVS